MRNESVGCIDHQEPKASKEKMPVSIDQLKDLAIYLEGIYQGKGNVLPLGKQHIENLWNVIDEYRRR